MKKSSINILFLLSFILLTFSCKKENLLDIQQGSEELNEFKEKDNKQINKFEEPSPTNPLVLSLESFYGHSLQSGTPPSNNETQAYQEATVLMNNSISLLSNSYGLTHNDLIDIFDYIDNPEIAYAALSLKLLDEIGINNFLAITNPCNSNNIIVRCAVRALLPCDIIDILEEYIGDKITNKILSVVWTKLPYSAKKEILRSIGRYGLKRMGGFIGLTFAVYEFTDCITSTQSPILDPNPNPEIPISWYVPINKEYTIHPDSLYLIEGQNTYYNYYHSYLRTHNEQPFPSTLVYYNGANNKYYLDSLFSKQIPDGHYIFENDFFNGTFRFRKVENGIVIYVATPDIPVGTPFEFTNPLLYNPFYLQ